MNRLQSCIDLNAAYSHDLDANYMYLMIGSFIMSSYNCVPLHVDGGSDNHESPFKVLPSSY